ncbi:hypothetical protein T4B_7657 [Trichinella pseudospiralis]|uniref:Uncharacterized protein n=1 Tax=Trichinella pseudospiralis TaxID=6337 RepID=A0A0V1J4V6_TRIPS|nr:hypothetical protein T4B_7657 [Trichinella pseudospiralis]KRZ42327.1 hypothetical protein T4C_5152 [Trichinella pseudospiralis]
MTLHVLLQRTLHHHRCHYSKMLSVTHMRRIFLTPFSPCATQRCCFLTCPRFHLHLSPTSPTHPETASRCLNAFEHNDFLLLCPTSCQLLLSERQDIFFMDDYLPVCFLSLTCDASFPPHFSYTPAKNIVPLPARMTYPNAAMKGVPQNDLLISCWCSTVCHVASSTTVSPFPTPEIQHYMLQLRQQTAVTSALLNNRLAFLKAAADKSVV